MATTPSFWAAPPMPHCWGGDPQKAAALCERAVALAPHDQVTLSTLGTAWRLMEDERDETLNGYDTLIQSIELDPAGGFFQHGRFQRRIERRFGPAASGDA